MNENILHLGYLILRLNNEKDRKKMGEQEIKDRIYLLHIDGEIILEIDESPVLNYNKHGLVNSAPKIKDNEYPLWAKKIEREISKKTHPDKLVGKSKEEIEEKTDLFLKAKEKIKNKKFADLIPIALSLGVDFSKYKKDFKNDISDRINQIYSEIKEIQKTISWQWQEYSESEKITAIEIILKQSGIKRSKTEIKKAINKRIKRKTGTRPKSLKEIRGLK